MHFRHPTYALGRFFLIFAAFALSLCQQLHASGFVQEAKLLASDGSFGDRFGNSVSISGDTAIVGMKDDNSNGNGSAYVYVRTGGVWVEQARLLASDGYNGDNFGRAVSIDGDTAVVSADYDDSYTGSVYVFVRSNGVWSEQAKLQAGDRSSGDYFGVSVDLEGDTVVVGAYQADAGGNTRGSAYVFVRGDGAWAEQAKLTAVDAADSDWFGRSVAVSGDTIIVGSPWDDDGGDKSGGAYIFTRADGLWEEEAKLLASDGAASDRFGWSVSIDGDLALCGAFGDSDNGSGSGSVYAYERANGEWSEQAKLLPQDGAASDGFGGSLQLEGDTVAIGASGGDDYGNGSGSAYVFKRVNGIWTEEAKLLADDGAAGDGLGSGGLGLSGDRIVLGAQNDGDKGFWSGSAYIFNINPPQVTVTFKLGVYGTLVSGELTQTVGINGAAQTPVISVLPGWAFSGWDSDFSVVTEAMTVTAQYVPLHEVRFDLGDYGSILSGALRQSVGEGFSAEPPEIAVAENWTFVGWDKSYHDISGPRTVVAQYAPSDLAGLPSESKLLAGDGAAEDRFGISVHLDGDSAIVGSIWDDDKGNKSGSAYVYVRSDGIWTQQAKLLASDGESNDNFGIAVAIRGNRAIVGAHHADDNGNDSGSAYVFSRFNGVWAEEAKLLPNDGASEDYFGWSVALSGDTALVGAFGDDDKGTYSGSAYVFVRNNHGQWSEEAKLLASDGVLGDKFGMSVSVDADTAVVGAYEDSDLGGSSGSAYVFVREDGVWSEHTKLLPSDGEAWDYFGYSVSLSGDTVIVGAYENKKDTIDPGKAYVFERSDGVWSEQAKLLASDGGSDDRFGYSVSLSGDIAVISALEDSDNGTSSGSAYIYKRSNGSWVEQAKLLASDGRIGDYFGKSVCVSGDTVIVGAYWSDALGSGSGSSYIYDIGIPPYTVTFELDAYGSLASGELIQLVRAGLAAVAPGVNAVAGWAFAGWDADFSSVDSDMTVAAQYVPTHTVTFDLGDYGSLLSGGLVQEVGEGFSAQAPDISVDAGWAFIGWDQSYQNITSSITITAQYIPSDLAVVLDEGKLANRSEMDSFGYSVGISGDTIVVGSHRDTGRVRHSGRAYVYIRSNGIWEKQADLFADDGGEYDRFGWSVSISGDTIVVGAYEGRGNVSESGCAYVFKRLSGAWTQEAKLYASDGAQGDYYGHSVCVDNDTIIVGAPVDSDDGLASGSAFVYKRVNGVWVEQVKLTARDATAFDWFGNAVSVSGDAVVVGAFRDSPKGDFSGSAYVFALADGVWAEQAKLTAGDGAAGDNFGCSVSVSGDTVIVGAYKDDDHGSAYIFARSNGNWTQQRKVFPEDGAYNDRFGWSVSLSVDTAIVGAYLDDDLGRDSGSAFVYMRESGVWGEPMKLLAENGESGDVMGRAVSVSADTVAIGATGDTDLFFNEGSVSIFVLPSVRVSFDLGGKGTRSGGGELDQLIRSKTPALEPEVAASPGWFFEGWDNDFRAVTSDMTVTAVYSDAQSSDGDAMWDGWEIKHLGSTTFSDGSIDSDGDGVKDMAEFEAGTDPMDRADYFRVMEQALVPDDGKVTLRFRTNDDLGDRRYRIRYAEDLNVPKPWPELPLGSFAPDAGDYTEKTFDVPGPATTYFFKVEAYVSE